MHGSGKVPTLPFVNVYGSQAKMMSASFTIIRFELLSSIWVGVLIRKEILRAWTSTNMILIKLL